MSFTIMGEQQNQFRSYVETLLKTKDTLGDALHGIRLIHPDTLNQFFNSEFIEVSAYSRTRTRSIDDALGATEDFRGKSKFRNLIISSGRSEDAAHIPNHIGRLSLIDINKRTLNAQVFESLTWAAKFRVDEKPKAFMYGRTQKDYGTLSKMVVSDGINYPFFGFLLKYELEPDTTNSSNRLKLERLALVDPSEKLNPVKIVEEIAHDSSVLANLSRQEQSLFGSLAGDIGILRRRLKKEKLDEYEIKEIEKEINIIQGKMLEVLANTPVIAQVIPQHNLDLYSRSDCPFPLQDIPIPDPHEIQMINLRNYKKIIELPHCVVTFTISDKTRIMKGRLGIGIDHLSSDFVYNIEIAGRTENDPNEAQGNKVRDSRSLGNQFSIKLRDIPLYAI